MKKKIIIGIVIMLVVFTTVAYSATVSRFSDVPTSHPFAEAIDFVGSNSIMNGTNGKFHPNEKVSRGQLAQTMMNYEQHFYDVMDYHLDNLRREIKTEETTVMDVISKSLPSVVLITNNDETLGTGFFIQGNRILTNHHVVEGAKNNMVKVYTTMGEVLDGKILKSDPGADLALVQIQADFEHNYLEFEYGAQQGQTILMIGNPGGLVFTAHKGMVANDWRQLGDDHARIQMDMNSFGGFSGSPIINMRGKVIGVLYASVSSNEGISFAVHYDDIQKFLSDIPSQ